MRAVRPLVLTVAAALIATPLMPVAAHAAASPTVSITSPTSASMVTGKVTVAVAGNVDPTDIDGALTTLLVNDTPVGPAQHCGQASPGSSADCPTTFSWDSTELNGSYALTAYLQVPSALGRVSATASVTAANPLPVVSITAPAAHAVVKGGTLNLHATGTVELSQNDQPTALQLWVDGAKYGLPQTCTVVVTTTQSCDADFTVHQPTWTGTHTVQVTMTTSRSSATGAVVPYVFFSPTRLSLSPIPTLRAGKRVVIRGLVTALNAGSGLAGARVVVTLSPAVGKKRSLVVHTGPTGHFSLATKLTANTTIAVSLHAATGYGASRAGVKAKALAPIVCKADLSIRRGRFGAGTCTVAHLPDGTKVTLQYRSKKTWRLLGAGTTQGTSIPVSYSFGAPGSYPVRLVLGASKVYAATYGVPFTVQVS